LALLVFYLFFAVISGTREHQLPVLQYAQTIWLQWMMLGVVVALVLLGSILFSAPSANATISIVLVFGILLLGRHLGKVALQEDEPARSLLYTVYFMIPHLEWYDVRDLLIYNQPLIAWVDVALATLYAGAYAGLFLFVTWLMFRRKALHL
jgi:hypothetical protein